MSQPDTPGTELARQDTQRIPVDLNDPLADLDQAFRLATMLAQSSMVPRALQGSPQNCLVTMLLGRELGLSWIQAIRGIYVLPSGQPGLRGTLLLARIRSAGHRYEFHEDDESCEFVIKRKDEEYKISYVGRFSLHDAKAAGLVRDHDGKLVARSRSGEPLPWELYRRDMLQWRAVARGAARGCPELIFGFDLAGIGDGEDGGVITAEVIPQPAPAQPNGQAQPDMRDKLAELDRQHSQDAAQPKAHADQDGPKVETADGIIVEDLPQVEEEVAAEPVTPPGLPELHELLRRCGFTGPQQTRTSASLAHREITDMGQLTAGEIFMVHDTLTRVTWGQSSMRDRHDAVERYIATAEGVGEDGENADR
jgi:hypothetical protein